MRILIVEDERALCDTLVKSLKQKGYEVDACYDGDSALDWLLAEKYDLPILYSCHPRSRKRLVKSGDTGIPVPDYVDENVSDKVVKIIQSYTGVVNKMVWRKY